MIISALAQASDTSDFLFFIQKPLQKQLTLDKHRAGCADGSR